MRPRIAFALIFLGVAALASAATKRDYIRDLACAAGGALSATELEIAQYVLVYRLEREGLPLSGYLDEALARLEPEDYEKAIEQAARIAKAPAAKGLLRVGKKGENLLKALIIASDKAYSKVDRAIDAGAAEYDRNHR
jgi:hypothetical protein